MRALPFSLRRGFWEPNVFTNIDAEARISDIKGAHILLSGREIALLIKDAVVRKIFLSIGKKDLAVENDGDDVI